MTRTSSPQPQPRRPRRAPAPDERKLDAERSRRLLLEAALEEFAAKGFAGARVQDIADRAGLNKQLINYYFGGKEGLYQALNLQWLEKEAEFNDPGVPLDEVVVRYLRHALADPRGTRLNAWRALTGDVWEEQQEDLSDLERRQSAGELAADLDPASVMLLMIGAVSAPAVMPHAVRRIFGLEPDSPEFQERYTEQLRRMIRRLAEHPEEGERSAGTAGERAPAVPGEGAAGA
ncbi:TetR family transcriptional regulator [Streptomyces palmae]|uniref:TetR/AcrR family transcriptional regulator n=1 Tax=Streptomyces palmae TaxID=1701085 RepID=A0A4Z0HBW2_9ACTN|nr:TetR family transcriptional regulator [Streptomyces palmae]TGB13900.1 TetR/AcrR family transcriptional regulator [Streptomyces palmae]